MKKYLIIILLALTVTVSTYAQSKEHSIKQGYHIYFYNLGDPAKGPPVMEIAFSDVTEAEQKQIDIWQKDIQARLNKGGGLQKPVDYNTLGAEILRDYMSRFTNLGTVGFSIIFPRKSSES